MIMEGADQPVQILGEKPLAHMIGGPFRSCDFSIGKVLPLNRTC